MQQPRWKILVFFSLFISSLAPAANVYVASSLVTPMTQLNESGYFEPSPIVGSSSSLARQIVTGAPADLFLSANQQWAEYVANNLTDASLRPFLENQLVLAQHASANTDPLLPLVEIIAGKHGLVVTGDPSIVPLGQYAAQVAEQLGVNRLPWIPARSASHAVKLLELGEVEWGILYATDVKASPSLTLTKTISPELHQPLIYWAVVLTPEGEKLYQQLNRLQAKELLWQLGFSDVPD
uniref:molybdate ABC transporter substrate-binding protein n=1 Tax=Thaumasiovibrio occultus TaxID=1891184 RepID=UPI000B34FFAE|nr:molybdate ABC transporter substrate-binding protein [Thaumasiovibrio occultus]